MRKGSAGRRYASGLVIVGPLVIAGPKIADEALRLIAIRRN